MGSIPVLITSNIDMMALVGSFEASQSSSNLATRTNKSQSLAGWHTFTVDLQHKILDRMRGLGMTPILPAFAGHVPKGLIDLFKPNYTELVRFLKFNDLNDVSWCNSYRQVCTLKA